jgi:hypothetical protein
MHFFGGMILYLVLVINWRMSYQNEQPVKL